MSHSELESLRKVKQKSGNIFNVVLLLQIQYLWLLGNYLLHFFFYFLAHCEFLLFVVLYSKATFYELCK